VSVLLGRGDGTFQSSLQFASGSGPYCIATGDFNGDSKPDLAVANAEGHNVSVLMGNGNGTFQPALNIDGLNGPYSLTSGDFNGDGKTDLIVANAGRNNVSMLAGNGNGTFQPTENVSVGKGPFSVVVSDFNGIAGLISPQPITLKTMSRLCCRPHLRSQFLQFRRYSCRQETSTKGTCRPQWPSVEPSHTPGR
jgi:hypothetical protein